MVKPSFRIGLTNSETRALIYRFVFERGEPQYIIRDISRMQPLMDEVVTMGGRLEFRGEVATRPYFLISWPGGGPTCLEDAAHGYLFNDPGIHVVQQKRGPGCHVHELPPLR